ncbi:hypothetical protein D3C72_2466910 [compost metagenome]
MEPFLIGACDYRPGLILQIGDTIARGISPLHNILKHGFAEIDHQHTDPVIQQIYVLDEADGMNGRFSRIAHVR